MKDPEEVIHYRLYNTGHGMEKYVFELNLLIYDLHYVLPVICFNELEHYVLRTGSPVCSGGKGGQTGKSHE